MKRISIGVPVYNEESIVLELIRRIRTGTASLNIHEIIFIDDGSTDRTPALIKEICGMDPQIKLISLSRNFGHQVAISSAIDHATGDALVIMDGDLQDPPEVIQTLVKKWNEGYAIVYAQRTERRGETWFKRITASLFYRILGFFSEVPIPFDTGDFCLMDQKVIRILQKMPERARFVRGLRAWTGFSSIGVPYERDPRHAGKTKYSLSKMFRFATNGIFSFSTIPLRFATYSGIFMAGVSFLVGMITIYIKLTTNVLIPGWASIVLALSFASGVQLLVLGVIGEYIGRLYEEVRARPLYIIKEQIGFGESEER